MKKSDLKNGMIVEIRTGEKYLVHNDKLLSDNLVGHLSLNEELLGYDDDLREANNVKIYDIMKVYESHSESISTLFENYNLKLIWDRNDDFEKLDIGDIVTILDKDMIYVRYTSFFEKEKLPMDYAARYMFNKMPNDNSKYKILHLGKNYNCKDTIAVIEEIGNEGIYLYSTEGLKIVKNQMIDNTKD